MTNMQKQHNSADSKKKPKHFRYVLLGQYLVFIGFVLVIAEALLNVSNETFMNFSLFFLPGIGVAVMFLGGIYGVYQESNDEVNA